MTHKQTVTILWLLLVAVTLGGSLLGETVEPGYLLLTVVVMTMAIKGRVVIDHFMELKNANPLIRRLMQAYFYVLPLATITSYVLSTSQ